MNTSFFYHPGQTYEQERFAEKGRGGKVILDPVWGYMSFNPILVALIDTPQFQRLRELKQLGTTYFIFPGASHNRFEHSLGTCYLADVLISTLQAKQPELNITSHEVLAIQIAALCHDLGHGPFSHVFDQEVVPLCQAHRSNQPWRHETGSEMMLQAAVKEARLKSKELMEPLREEDVQFIRELINPDNFPQKSHPERQFLYEIVSNSSCGIDVDKFDYIARDSANVGIKISFDARRLLRNCRIIDNRLCFHYRTAFDVYELFHARYTLFKQVYSHRVGKAVEYMLRDIILIADPFLHITDKIWDPALYLELTDSIVHHIEYSKQPELDHARHLLRRLRRRDIYTMVFEAPLLPGTNLDSDSVTPQHIVSAYDELKLNYNNEQKSEEVSTDKKDIQQDYITQDIFTNDSPDHLDPNNIIVQHLTLDYGKGEKNPVNYVQFFKNWDDTSSFTIDRQEVSMLAPSIFIDKHIRVYSRTNIPSICTAISYASIHCQQRFSRVVPSSLPDSTNYSHLRQCFHSRYSTPKRSRPS